MRGLIDEADDTQRLQPVYTVSMDFVRHLGLHQISDLPDFDQLHMDEKITNLVGSLQKDVEIQTEVL
jgi:chromosome segregation and condensation protein ScpB